MNKEIFTKRLRSWCLLCLMLLLGVGNAVGAETKTLIFDFEDITAHRTSGQNSYTTNSYEENGVSISLLYADAVSSAKISGSYNVTCRVAKNTTNSPSVTIGPIAITNETVTGISYNQNGVSTINQVLEYSLNGTDWTTGISSFATTSTTGSKSVSNLSLTGSQLYVRISGTVASTTKSSRDFLVDDITITYTTGPTATLQSLAISGTPTKTTYEAGDAFDPTGLTVTGTYDNKSTATITEGIEWTLDPATLTAGATSCNVTATVGTITSSSYTVEGLTVTAKKTLSSIAVSGTYPTEFWKGETFSHEGAVVTATYVDEEGESTADVTAEATFSTPDMTTAGEQTITVTYKDEETTYKINVKTIANTQETAYTVAQIKEIVDAKKDLSTAVYVKGTVSNVVSTAVYSGKLNYYISDDGEKTSQQFEFYGNYKGADSEQWSDVADVTVGDDVIGYGTATLFNNTTYEFSSGNYLVSHTKATTFSIENIAVKKGETITPMITTNISGDYTVTYTNSSNNDIVSISDNKLCMGTETGTATITAEISADGYKTVTTTFTVTVTSDATLTSITVSGDLTKSTYEVGDEFSFEGLTATGNYSDETTADLTNTVEWTVEPTTLTAATTSVTVKATSGEIFGTKDYDVTVNKKASSIEIADMTIGKNATDVTISATTTPEDAVLEYAITEGSDYITIEDGKISAKAPGTATVKATYAGNDEYASAETSFTVTVSDASMATYTFSEFTSDDDVTLANLDGFIITLSKGTGSTKPAWVSTANEARVYACGSLTVKATNADIKSIVYEYTVNANKSGTVPTIEGVAGKTIAGTWNADTKTWIGSDNEVTFSTSGSAGNVGFTKLTITYAESTKTETSLAWSASEATVTMDANDNVFPTLTTTPENLEGVTYESSATAIATIDDNGTITLLAPGTTIITAKFAGDDTYAEALPVSYTLTVNEAPFVPTPIGDIGYEVVDFTAQGYTNGQELTVYKGTSFKVEFSKGTGSTPKYYTSDNTARVYANNTMEITAAEDIIAVVINYTEGSANASSINGNTALITFTDKACFTSMKVIYKLRSYPVTIADGGYTTLYLDYATVIPEGTKAYYISSYDSKKDQLTATSLDNYVPANTGIIVKGTKNTSYTFTETTETVEAVENNLLKKAAEFEGDGDDGHYFELDDGWYYLSVDGKFKKYEGSATMNPNKAYLYLDKYTRSVSGGAKGMGIEFDDASGIEETSLSPALSTSEGVYNLNGMRVNENYKGVVIKNGKKFLIK